MSTVARAAVRAARLAVDLLFPPKCAVCRQEGRFICPGCEAALPKLQRPYCPLCASPGASAPCSSCQEWPPAYDRILAPYLMEGAARDMVYDLKYRNIRASAPELGRLMAGLAASDAVPADMLVPVPLHRRRERERGYNQAELLARQVSVRTGIPLRRGVLQRVNDAPPQVSMSGHEERRRNIEGAFRGTEDLSGQKIMLVDDVVTTGSTMAACAAALKAAGASSVWGLAFARQS